MKKEYENKAFHYRFQIHNVVHEATVMIQYQ